MSREFLAYKALLAALGLAFAYVVLCSLDYGNPVYYRVREIRTPVVHQGETFRAFLTFTRLRECRLDRHRIVIDGEGGWHDVLREHLDASGLSGQEERLKVEVPITDAFAPGEAYYRAVLAYRCPLVVGPFTFPNLLQQLAPKILANPDLPFTIAPRRPPPS